MLPLLSVCLLAPPALTLAYVYPLPIVLVRDTGHTQGYGTQMESSGM